MITLSITRNIDLIEQVANHPEIQPGAAGGEYFSYNPQEVYIQATVNGELAGIIRASVVQRKTWECHAMFLPHMRGFGRDIALKFWEYLFTNTDAECVLSMASDKFKNGKFFCVSVGLKRRGVVPKFFNGETDVTFYSATREELGYGRRR